MASVPGITHWILALALLPVLCMTACQCLSVSVGSETEHSVKRIPGGRATGGRGEGPEQADRVGSGGKGARGWGSGERGLRFRRPEQGHFEKGGPRGRGTQDWGAGEEDGRRRGAQGWGKGKKDGRERWPGMDQFVRVGPGRRGLERNGCRYVIRGTSMVHPSLSSRAYSHPLSRVARDRSPHLRPFFLDS